MFKQLFISLLLPHILTLTWLTFNNCPADFDPNNYNTSLNTNNQQLANSLYGSIYSAETQQKIQLYFDEGNMDGVTQQAMAISVLIPYILIGVLFFLLFCTTSCCCLFQRRCPPCESWRRNYIKDPYSTLQLRATMIAAVLFVLGILITTIIVFSSFGSLRQDTNMTKCALYYCLDTALNGDQNNQWGGFSQVQTQLSNVTSLINSTAASATSLSGNEWIRSQFDSLRQMNLALWEDNKDSVVYTPNPTTTQNAFNTGTPIPTIVPLFIQSGLGPNGTADTMITDIDSSYESTKEFVDQAYRTYMSAMGLINAERNITINTNANLESISVAVNYLTSIKQAVEYFDTSFLTPATDIYLYVIEAVFALVLLGSLLSLFGILSTHVFDILRCTKMVTLGWVIYGIVYFAIILVMTFFLSAGGVTYTFCQYFSDIIDSQSGYLSFTQSKSTSSFNKFFGYLDVCFFEDGNMLQKFSVASEMKTVSDVFENTQTTINMQTSGNAEYVDINVAPGKLLSWMSVMTKYGDGIYVDAPSSVITDDNPYIALSHMNEFTDQSNSATNDVLCSHDYWAFDNSNCTFGVSESVYTPGPNDTIGLYHPLTGTLCISLNSRLSSTAPSIWTTSDIANRYLSLRQCNATSNSSGAYTQLIEYAQSITNYRDSRINLYQSLYSQLSNILSVNTIYNTNLTTFTSQLNTFSSSVATLSNVVTNQNNGLTISSNCTIIAKSLRFFYNMYCVNFLNRTVKIAISCIILLILMLISVILGAVFGVRYGRVQKQRKFESSNQILKSDQFERSQRSMTSSSEEDG